jgi:hypothetical protein
VNLEPGLHKVRWQIGDHLWTDTVSVGQSEVTEKHLFAETGFGRLNVSASFGGSAGSADILIDGIAVGKGTPAELRGIAAGPHEVTLTRDGFRMRNGPRIARVRPDDRTRVQIEMIRR